MSNNAALLATGALLVGTISSSSLMALVGGGWKQEVAGYVAWALMPYAVLLIACIGLRRPGVHPPVRRLLLYEIILVSLGGPLLFIDAMFIHVDAQGALAVLMIPVIQTFFGLLGVVTAVLWQWHSSRFSAKPAHQADGIRSTTDSASRSARGPKRWIRAVLVVSILVAAPLFALISFLQSSDSKAMETAKEVDVFISQYCRLNGGLPSSVVLIARFPHLTRDTGWFFFTDDKTYLKMQYPMQWWNGNAVGYPKISEFTATPYAYSVDYQCNTSQ